MTSRLLVLLVGCSLAVIGSMAAPTITTDAQIWQFMMKYGYISAENMINGLPKDEETKTKSVTFFQKMGNMTMSGTLSTEDMELMNTPRCGMKDMESEADMMRKKRFALGSKWPRTDLTWRIINRTPDLPAADVDRIMEKALTAWSDVSSLTFREVTSGDADILISFARREHGDGPDGAFDGPSGVLAHAYFPITNNPIGGDAHFDEDETYTDGSRSGINLFQVAAHEFGHSLGLRHSDVEDALMFPYYRGYVPNFQLHSDDINGIRAHYGEGNGLPEERDTPSTPLDNCMPQISLATRTLDGSAYFANDTHVFRRNGNTIPAGYPKRIGDEFPQLPTGLDAALFYDPYTYFFKGSEYWRFRNQQMEGSYPRPMTDWSGVPNDIDSAYVWSRNGRIYFTKGNEYYAYYPGYGVSSYYPQPLTHWRGLPADGVDAAFQYSNAVTYFFKGSDYYRFDDTAVQVASGYPINTAIQWLGCDPNELNIGSNEDNMGGDASVMLPSMVAVLFSTLSALYYSF